MIQPLYKLPYQEMYELLNKYSKLSYKTKKTLNLKMALEGNVRRSLRQ